MSNALCALAQTETTSSPAAEGAAWTSFEMGLLAAGICVLAAWLLIRIMRPGKLTLRNRPGRPNDLNPVVPVALYLLLWLVANLAATFVAKGQGIELVKGQPSPPTVLVPSMIVSQIVLIVCALVVAKYFFRSGLQRGLGLSARRWVVDTLRAVVAVLAVWPVCIGLYYLMGSLVPIKPDDLHPVLLFVREASWPWLAASVLGTVVLAPIWEELLYRGLLQSMLRKHLGAWPAVLVSSALFAATHWNQPQAIPSLLVLAVVMGYCYERTGRLFSPILIHALFNAANLYSSWLKVNG